MSPRLPRRLVALAAVLLAAGMLWAFFPSGSPSAVEQVLRAHEKFTGAILDRDYDDVWDHLGNDQRFLINWQREYCVERGEGSVRGVRMSLDEIADMDGAEFFEALMEGIAAEHPTDLARDEQRLRDTGIRQIVVDGNYARVHGDGAPWDLPEYIFHYMREDDGWKFMYSSRTPPPFLFKTLSRMVDAPLPRGTVDPASVDLIIQITAGRLSDESLDLLKQRVIDFAASDPDLVTVLIDAAPGVPWGDVVRAQDAVRRSERPVRILYAAARTPATGEGITVNGVPLDGAALLIREAPVDDVRGRIIGIK
jgi:hypothetical protein